ncbi:MAG: helix-turn-helix transcriptional regulator [Solirubrobacterales bacterium]|nr:helix-turn-helix transcriptional regulator [Solirubrobacterales bacterium]
MSDRLDAVFGALADPTRRTVVERLLRDGATTVPDLTRSLPITRQAVAKHLTALGEAGLVERDPSPSRPVRYRLKPSGLDPAATWIAEAGVAWDARLDRLKRSIEA